MAAWKLSRELEVLAAWEAEPQVGHFRLRGYIEKKLVKLPTKVGS